MHYAINQDELRIFYPSTTPIFSRFIFYFLSLLLSVAGWYVGKQFGWPYGVPIVASGLIFAVSVYLFMGDSKRQKKQSIVFRKKDGSLIMASEDGGKVYFSAESFDSITYREERDRDIDHDGIHASLHIVGILLKNGHSFELFASPAKQQCTEIQDFINHWSTTHTDPTKHFTASKKPPKSVRIIKSGTSTQIGIAPLSPAGGIIGSMVLLVISYSFGLGAWLTARDMRASDVLGVVFLSGFSLLLLYISIVMIKSVFNEWGDSDAIELCSNEISHIVMDDEKAKHNVFSEPVATSTQFCMYIPLGKRVPMMAIINGDEQFLSMMTLIKSGRRPTDNDKTVRTVDLAGMNHVDCLLLANYIEGFYAQ